MKSCILLGYLYTWGKRTFWRLLNCSLYFLHSFYILLSLPTFRLLSNIGYAIRETLVKNILLNFLKSMGNNLREEIKRFCIAYSKFWKIFLSFQAHRHTNFSFLPAANNLCLEIYLRQTALFIHSMFPEKHTHILPLKMLRFYISNQQFSWHVSSNKIQKKFRNAEKVRQLTTAFVFVRRGKIAATIAFPSLTQIKPTQAKSSAYPNNNAHSSPSCLQSKIAAAC